MDFHTDIKKENRAILFALLFLVAGLVVYSVMYSQNPERQGGELTEQDKLKILNQLKENAPTPPSLGERAATLDTLSEPQSDAYEYSDEGKLQILRSLGEQSQ